MSFLPSYITSTLLPPLPTQLLPSSASDPKLVVKVTPLRPSSFAGETFQARITFSLEEPLASAELKEPGLEGEEAQPAGNLFRRPSAPVSSSSSSSLTPTASQTKFKPAHRSAQSLSNPYIPSLHPASEYPASSPSRSVSASHAQRKVSNNLPAGHPHARKPSFAPLQNGGEGGDVFSAEEVPTMSSLRRTSAASAPPKSPMTALSSILEGDANHALHEAEDEDDPSGTEGPPVPTLSVPPTGSSSSAPSSLSSRPNGHRKRSSIALGHGPPPNLSAGSSPLRPISPAQPAVVEPASGLTISWSHMQLQATLTPSPQYFPPESLLPLRQALLESSTMGSGSLPTSTTTSISEPTSSLSAPSAGGWFSLPPPPRHARAPSLTSSLFGMARTMWSGAGVENTGSLEEERRRMWERTVKEVPVFETLKSVCGVGMELQGATSTRDATNPLDFTYSVPLPPNLPPTFKGKAIKISYSLIITVEVEYPQPPARPGYDNEAALKRRRTKAVTLKVPINVWGGTDEPTMKRGYDLMRPIIQRTQAASLDKTPLASQTVLSKGPSSDQHPKERDILVSSAIPATRSSFLSYAAHLFSTLPPRELPFPPPDSTIVDRKEKHKHTRSQALSPSTFTQSLPEVHINGSDLTTRAEGEVERARRMERLASLDSQDQRDGEDLVDDLLRASKKASYDIEKEEEVVAVLTLFKSAFRLGETVSGVVTFNAESCKRRVLKFSAYLQSHEVVPSSLQAPNGPKLKPFIRTHASHHSSLTPQATRIPFNLDFNAPGSSLGSAISPSFTLRAGEAPGTIVARPGGLHWKVHVSFLVSAPSRSQPTSVEIVGQSAPGHLLAVDPPSDEDELNDVFFRPTPSIAPVVKLNVRADGGKEGTIYQEMRTEVVECDVDVAMFAPSRLGMAALNVGEQGGQDEASVTFVV